MAQRPREGSRSRAAGTGDLSVASGPQRQHRGIGSEGRRSKEVQGGERSELASARKRQQAK